MVFPGGAIDRADHVAAQRFFANVATCSGATTDAQMEEAAFKIGAARELFEEAGINLARGTAHNADGDTADTLLAGLSEDMAEGGWRDKLRSGETTWGEMAASVGAQKAVRAVNGLFDWCSFITPDAEAARLKKGGFYTKFFGAACPAAAVPSASADAEETVMLCWLSPEEALHAAASGAFFLAPPQYFILTQLAENCPTLESIPVYASSNAHRITREYPIKPYPIKMDPDDEGALTRMSTTAVAITMPGDELHPVFPGESGCKNRIYMSDKLGQLAAGTSYTYIKNCDGPLQYPLPAAKIDMFQTVGQAKL